MRLEDGRDDAVAVQFSDALGTLVDLVGMVGIVRQQHVAVVLDLEIEPSVHAAVALHALAQFLSRATVELCHRHSSHAVLDIDGNGLSQFYMRHALDGRDEVERYLAVVYPDVLGMEIALVQTVFVDRHTRLYLLLHLQVGMQDECATRLDERGVVPETLQVGFFSTVDVQVVGVGGCDDAHPRSEPVETAVKLVSLDDDIVAVVTQDIVGAIVLGDTAQKGVAVDMALVHDVGAHGRCRSLAVCACHTESLMRSGKRAQHLCPLLNGKAVLPEIDQFLMPRWYGWGVDDQTGGCVLAHGGYGVHVFLVVDGHAFLLQLSGER